MRILAVFAAILFASAAEAQRDVFVRLRALAPIAVAAGDESGPQAFTLADVDNDGILDLAVIDPDEDQVAVSIGLGDGTFAAARVYEVDDTPTAVAVADLSSPFASDQSGDVDGNPDLVIAYEDGSADVWLGRGDGEFDLPEQDLSDVLDSAELIGIVVGDFDGNGRNDLALLDFFDEVYFLCNQSGNLAACNNDVIETMGEGSLSIAGGDFDGDTFLDVAVLSIDSEDVSVIFGNGDGSFDEVEETIPTPESDEPPSHMVAGRLDADQIDDLVVAHYSTLNDFSLLGLYGRPGRGFSSQRFAAPFGITGLALGDLNRDEIPDALLITDGTGAGGISFGDGSGGFSEPFQPLGGPLRTGRAVLTGDLNGDDRPDVAILSPDGLEIQVSLNEPPPMCAGDCDGSGAVSIDELVLAVRIALGDSLVGSCQAIDTNGSGGVEINELIAAVGRALAGCA
jgi:FG-GAP-like repeat